MDITRNDTEAVTHDVKITGNEHLKEIKKKWIMETMYETRNILAEINENAQF